jgi:hypothetical protein
MQHCDVSCAKQAHVLFRNEIRKIVMVSDSDEDKHYASKESEDEGEPRPPSWWCCISRPSGPIATRPAIEHGSRQIKLFFHLLDLAIVNSCLLLSACGGKRISRRDFRLTLIREMLARTGHEPQPSMSVAKPAQTSGNFGRLDTSHNKHRHGHSHTKRWCLVCSVGAWSGRWYLDVWSVTWCFVLTETVLRIITQRQSYDIYSSVLHTYSWSLDHNVSTWCVQGLLIYVSKITHSMKLKMQSFLDVITL